MGQIIQILKIFNRVIRFSYPFHKYECCKVYRTGTLIKEEYLSNSGNFFGLPIFFFYGNSQDDERWEPHPTQHP